MNPADFLSVAKTWGTPSYLFDLQVFSDRLQACQEIVGHSVKLCFAMKANPFLIARAAQDVSRLEVCSPGELALCMRANIPPKQIVYSGVNKEPRDIAEAMSYGAGVLTAESLLQVRYLSQVATEQGRVVQVLPRLNSGSQFGMSRDDLLWLVDHRRTYPQLELVGLHYFVGTQRKKLKRQLKELQMLSDLMDELRDEHGFEAQRLEYGPGLPVPYFSDDDFSDDLAPLKELAPALQQMAERVELTVEMGRFFAASCGTYLTRVMDVKANKGTNYAILDGGMHQLNYFGQMMGLHVPPLQNLSAQNAEGEPAEWCLCGSLCTVNDVLVRSVELPRLERGDVLAFGCCGAYAVTEGPNLFLSRTMPRVLLRQADGSVILARDFVESSALNGVAQL